MARQSVARLRSVFSWTLHFVNPSVAHRFLLYACLASMGCFWGIESAAAVDWFRWRGPDLNGISTEKDWSVAWPKEGPVQRWKASVGLGFSSMTVSQERVFTLGNKDNQDTVACLDAGTGRPVWHHTYPCGLRPQYYEGGTSSTPTIDDDRVYSLGKEGQIFCFEIQTGKVLWEKHLAQETGATLPRWCFSGSPLVQGDLLFVNVGSTGTALDKRSGKVVWSSQGVAGYASPVPLTLAAKPCLLIFSAKALVCVEQKDGHELWRVPWVTKWDLNIADPIVAGDEVLLSTFDQGSALFKVNATGAKEIWRNSELSAHFATPVLFNGSIYGIDGNTDKPPAELKCLDFATGKLRWKEMGIGFGSLTVADGKLIVLTDKGELLVAPASPTEFRPVARAQVLGGKCWTAPVLSNGKIYCRNAPGTLICLDVSKGAGQ